MNRLFSVLCCLVTLFLAPAAFAGQGTLVLPEHFEIISINGEQFGGLLTEKHRSTLAVGEHIIEVQYFDLLDDDDSDSHTKVRSTAQAFSLHVEAGHHYQLEATRPYDVDEAQAFAAHPQFVIKDTTSGHYLSLNVVSAQEQQASLLRQLLGSKPNKPVAALQPAAQPIAPVAQPSVPQKAVTAAAPKVEENHAPQDAESQLLYWWSQASAEQRQRFLTQVLSH